MATDVLRSRKSQKAQSPGRMSSKDRFDKLHERVVNLRDELITNQGIALPVPGPITPIADAVTDSKTGALIAHVEEPLGVYLQRVSVRENVVQRPPFNHMEDPIYRRLIRDFLAGAAMPESKVAALNRDDADMRAPTLDVTNISYSIIDGLQRLYCFSIATLLSIHGRALVEEGCITQDSWEYVNTGDQSEQWVEVKDFLIQKIRYEIFYNTDLEGFLHYMVTFNTGQRRMSLNVQLEIMQRPLLDQLKRAGIPVYHDLSRMPRERRPRDEFSAGALILATQAFLTSNPQVSGSKETERFLSQDEGYLDNLGDVQDVISMFRRIATEIHPLFVSSYEGHPQSQYILSQGGIFLAGFAAACGYIRSRINVKGLEAALDRLVELAKSSTDPFSLPEYHDALQQITTSRGKTTRRLVYDTFLRFFTGASVRLEWMDTMNQIR